MPAKLDLTTLSSHADAWRSADSSAGRVRRYPVRGLRYWFMSELIRQEAEQVCRGLDICEVGIGNGEMRAFMKTAETLWNGTTDRRVIQRWDAVSRHIDRGRIASAGYSRCIEHNIEDPDLLLDQQYDVIILLHILEHLFEPERTFSRLARFVKPGGLIIGGHPTVPRMLEKFREQRIRKTAERYGHVSVLSPSRVRRLAHRHHFRLELLTGAYLVRMSGSRLEDSGWWVRLNLLCGRLWPWWPGELYWSMRRLPGG